MERKGNIKENIERKVKERTEQNRTGLISICFLR